MNQPRYYVEDFESAKRSFAFTFLVVAFLTCVLAGTSFLAGYETRGYVEHERRAAEARQPKKASPAAYVPLLDCNARGYVEFRRTCGARARTTQVAP